MPSPDPVTSRRGFFWTGIERVESPFGTVVRGPMYVEWEEPVEVTQPYPIVLIHGGGGQGLDWMQTFDGRPGWAPLLVAARLQGLRRRPPGPRALVPASRRHRADGGAVPVRGRRRDLPLADRGADVAPHRAPAHAVARHGRGRRSGAGGDRGLQRADARAEGLPGARPVARRRAAGPHRPRGAHGALARRSRRLAHRRRAARPRQGARRDRGDRPAVRRAPPARADARLRADHRAADLRPAGRTTRPSWAASRGGCPTSPASRSPTSRLRRRRSCTSTTRWWTS